MAIVIKFRKRNFSLIGTTILVTIAQHSEHFVRIAIQHLYFPMENAKVAENKHKNNPIEMAVGILRQCRATKLARFKNTEIIVARNSYPPSDKRDILIEDVSSGNLVFEKGDEDIIPLDWSW